MKLFGTSKVM